MTRSRSTTVVAAAIAAIAASALTATTTHAQDAVQWRVEDGGNGHWYAVVGESLLWDEGQALASSNGGHLATITSTEENEFAWNVAQRRVLLGGFAIDSACDDSNWSWVTGEPFDLYLWLPGGNNFCTSELFLAFDGLDDGPGAFPGTWNNIEGNTSCCCCRSSALVEWSADCNGDGIVDYGQILDGTLADDNGDGVPDGCVLTSDGTTIEGDLLGFQLAVDGDHMIANTYKSNGGVSFFERRTFGWELTDFFPFAVDPNGLPEYFATRSGACIQDDWAFAGARFGAPDGQVRVYRFQDGAWNEFQTIDAPLGGGSFGAAFGSSIDFDGTRLIVGAFQESGNQSGGAHFYLFDGTNWILEQSILSIESASTGFFGISVAVDGDLAAVGSNDNGNSRGRVDVFKRIEGEWTGLIHLTPPDGANDDAFGSELAIDAGVLVVGQQGRNVDGAGLSGGVWGYDLNGVISPEPSFEITSAPLPGQRFGYRLSFQDGLLAVGTSPDDLALAPLVEIHRIVDTDTDLVRTISVPKSTWNTYYRQLLDVAIDEDTLFVGTTADGAGRIDVYGTPETMSGPGQHDPVQWRVEDGGNGHWYGYIEETRTWHEHREFAILNASDLATAESAGEWNFIRSLATSGGASSLYYLGLYQDQNDSEYQEPGGGWNWVSGTRLEDEVSYWQPGEPNDTNGGQLPTSNYCQFRPSNGENCWDDATENGQIKAIIEWSADCNGDGIVDYGQILDGTFVDCDGNGVPDECDLSETLAATEPDIPTSATDFIVFDVSSMGDAREDVSVEISARAGIADGSEFMFVYVDQTFVGLAFTDTIDVPEGEEECDQVFRDTIDVPVAIWNSAGTDGARSIRLSGNGIDDCDGRFTAVDVTVPVIFQDCNTDGVWDACTIADGTTPDGDGDGTIDLCDGCPNDPEKIEPGICGCGTPDSGDADDDGILDCVDPCPNWPYECSEDGQTLFVAVGEPIQEAVDAVPSGGTIDIIAATFPITSTIDPGGKAVTIRGSTDIDGNPATVLDGQDAVRLLSCTSGEGADTIFENLVISRGRAADAGGLYAEGSSPTFLNCRFEFNEGDGGIGFWGGAVYANLGAYLTFTDCSFHDNHASGDGGGVYARESDIDLENCTFTENSATYEGGSVWVAISGNAVINGCSFSDSTGRSAGAVGGGSLSGRDVSLFISNCTFIRNTTNTTGGKNHWGGGIYARDCALNLLNCDFDSNEAESGGGVLTYQCTFDIDGCTFTSNHADLYGGGFNNAEGGSGSLRDSTFDGNTTNGGGGGAFLEDLAAEDTVANCDFLNNTASTDGGGIQVKTSAPTIIDCVFARNDAGSGGGGLSNFPSGSPTVIRGVFEDNTADTGGGTANSSSSFPSYEGCTFTGNEARGINNPGAGAIYSNSGSNPSILDSTVCGNLQPGVDQIFGSFTDLGDNCISTVCDSDADGTLDCVDGCPDDPDKVDPGVCGCGTEDLDTDADGIADCVDPCPTWPYDCSEDGQTIFVSPDQDPVQSIALAISQVPTGGTVQLRAGVFTEPIDFGGRAITIQGDVSDPGSVVLDGTGLTDVSVVSMTNDEGPDSILRGITIRNGSYGTPFSGFRFGGGIYVQESNPTIEDCVLVGNTSEYGGGIYVRSGGPILRRLFFSENSADEDGGGLQLFDAGPSIIVEDCDFDANDAGNNGGAVHIVDGSPSLVRMTMTGNVAGARGGGVSVFTNGPVTLIDGGSITGNTAATDGGIAVLTAGGEIDVLQTSICGNSPNQISSGVNDLGGNCIVEECGNDLDGNGVPDSCDPDCDGDGIPDGLETDCDANGVPDTCDIADGVVLDCNENSVPDSCDIDTGSEEDDNANDVPDSCDIAAGDFNVDGCIDAEDLGTLLGLWGFPNPPLGDLDGDGTIGPADLGIILAGWRPCDP